MAFAAALGVMPLDMPESVLVRFSGARQPGITLRDIVNAIPYTARQQGLLTLDSAAKRNVFNGRIIEIEGLPDLTVEAGFRTVRFHRRALGGGLHHLAPGGVRGPAPALERDAAARASSTPDTRTPAASSGGPPPWSVGWPDPSLLGADPDARYAAVMEIDLATIEEPLLACPNDPDDVRPLSEVAGSPIDEVFIGSCMTHISHFRAAGQLLAGMGGPVPTRLWIAPPTKMDQARLRQEGYYSTFAAAGPERRSPGAHSVWATRPGWRRRATVVSTSTRNYPNRMGQDARVFLASAELAAMAAIQGELPSVPEYLRRMAGLGNRGDTGSMHLPSSVIEPASPN